MAAREVLTKVRELKMVERLAVGRCLRLECRLSSGNFQAP